MDLNPADNSTAIIDVAGKELSFTQDFEKQWQKTLTNSARKSREWLFRHAKEIYDFRQACLNNDLDLPETPKNYFALKMHEWLGYQDDAARKWANVGKFLYKFETEYTKSVSVLAQDLPVSMQTLLEFSRMSDDEFKRAINENLVHPEVTSSDVQEFRKKLTHERTQKEKSAGDFSKEKEADLLIFAYHDNVPNWIVEKLEDLAVEIDPGVVQANAPHRFQSKLLNGQETTVIVEFVKGRWEVTSEILANDTPSPDGKEKASTTTTEKQKPRKEPKGVEAIFDDQFVEALSILGINLSKQYVEKWALLPLMQAAYETYNPEKLGNDEIFNRLEEIEAVLTKK